jgi:DNA-binding response OmpR family regulator
MTGSARRKRVLVVEDDAEMREAYRRFFVEQHADEFSAVLASDGEQALGVLRHEPADLLVLDWNLPGISGASLAKALRSHALTRSLGILMVTGKSHASETVFALDSGADDYLVKPFDWNVLLARLRSLSRRADLTLERRLTASFPGLQLDLESDRLSVDGETVRLTPKEMELLRVFLTRPGILHPQSFLWESLWGYEADGWDHTLSVTISSLRGKLGKTWGSRLRSHKGRGYSFETEPGP